MTVNELIELLQKFPGDEEVRIQHDTPFCVTPFDVEIFHGMESDGGWGPECEVRYVLIA